MRWPFRRLAKERELDEEMLAHLAIEVKQRVEAGETPEEAERAARRQFGSVALVMEVTREMWGYGWLESLTQDLNYAVRTLRKTPGFTIVAILTLALGIGANTAIFSVLDAALLRPLPFAEPDRLVRVWATKNGKAIGVPSPLDMRDLASASHSFEGLLVYDHWRKNVSGILGSKEPEEMVVGLLPAGYFDVLRVQPLMGRLFTEEECQVGKHYVAAISSTFWKTRFASDPGILMRTLRINAETYSIVAVMPDVIPAWMDETSAPISIWTPFASAEIWSESARGAFGGDYSLGRLKPGVSYDQARAELVAHSAGLAREHPIDQGISDTIEPLADSRAGRLRPVLLLLAGAVGLVLLIACSNLAGLLLARNSVRYGEIAVRAALGVGRWRLARQLFIETMLLSLTGGVVGLLLSSIASATIARMSANPALPYISSVNALPQFWSRGVDLPVLLFAFGISVVTAILFGLAPAFTGARVSLADALREGGRGGAAGSGRQQFRRALVVAEMALSLVLLVAAGLLTQSIIRLQRQDTGFRPDHVLKAHFYLPPARFPDPAALTRFCDEFGQRLRALPGVLDASVTTIFPPYIRWFQMFTIDGQAVSRLADVPTARFGVIDSYYLRTMRIALIAGREFAESDSATSLPVALVNEEFVRRFFTDQNPIGRRIRLGPPPGLLPPSAGDVGSSSTAITVVGVVRNFMNAGMATPPEPQILALFRQQPDVNYGFKDIVVRTAMDAESIGPAVSRQLRSLDPDIPLGEVQTMTEYLAGQTSDARFTTVLLGLFAGLGTILAVIGAYGVIAYLVAQRTHELGVRIALGADSNNILWLVLRQGIAMGLAGVTLGVFGALATRQLLARLLFGVSGTDPWTLTGASLLLLLVVMTASAIPGRRAMRIDPVQALRNE